MRVETMISMPRVSARVASRDVHREYSAFFGEGDHQRPARRDRPWAAKLGRRDWDADHMEPPVKGCGAWAVRELKG